MANDTPDPLQRATRWEIVGAWLRIWTPGRDTYVPPVPVWRIVAGVTAAAAVVAALAVAAGGWKQHADERERREQAAADAVKRSSLARDQTAHRARVAPVSTPSDRVRLVAQLELAITADAQQRFSRSLLPSRVDHTYCVPYVRPRRANPPDPPLTATRARYECMGVSSKIEPTAGTVPGELGYPFWARADLRHGRLVWCKVNPRSAERGIGGDVYVPLDSDCDLPRG